MDQESAQAGGRRGRARKSGGAPTRRTSYRRMRNPFPVMELYSADHVAGIHEAALDILERLGVKVLLAEARRLFAGGGAKTDESTQMVWPGREMVEAALASAPGSFECRGAVRERDVLMEPGALVFQPGAGAPHATDLERGRRPAGAVDFSELVSITQHFDVLEMMPPLVEPQDVPVHLRHYFTMREQLTRSDKFPFIYSRGTQQAEESFEMIRDFRGLDDAAFADECHCYTIVNTNSPRQIDVPMAQGLIDFARAGQLCIVTPFTLMGAMAPVTPDAAMTLSHAEALAAITLTQLARPGARLCYGTFTSNVDMKSGAPAFGTPEHFQASIIAGQLARHVNLPWRCASGSAANINDAQAANETQFGMWGCLLAGATVIIHAAGWLEGGLSVSYEKLITDVEVLQMVAELCATRPPDGHAENLEAIAEVAPGGHFFGAAHTMKRYRTQFYEPLVADWSNFGTWSERGGLIASQRALEIWKDIIARDERPAHPPERIAGLGDYIERHTAKGGAPAQD